MADTVLKLHIKQRYDTEANWASKNPVLLAGEVAISSDKNGQYKTGDGTKKWSELAYNGVAWTNVIGRPSTMKNPSALTVQFNGTTNQTYDGSAAKTVNITPGAIGAAPSNHTHTKSQITDFPSALKNPNALAISLNGASQGAYDGSSAKSINVTAKNIGAIGVGVSINNLSLNTILDEGRYYSEGGNKCSDKPDGVDAFGLNVLRTAGGYKTQFLYSGTGTPDVLYSRTYSGSNWSSWNYYYSRVKKPTLAELGAAAVLHTHTKANITDFPSALKNPSALTLQFNGTTKLTYDGSSAGTLNITPAAIGAAPLNHTHNYAGSSSAGGIANSAAKWATARTITVGGDFTGSVSLDGSANASLNLYNYYSKISVGNKSNYPWHRIAKVGPLTGSYTDYASTLLITQDYHNGYWGMIKIVIRTNSATQVSTAQAEWLVRKGFSANDVKIAIYNVYGSTYADVYLCTGSAYCGTVIRDIESGGRGTVSRGWILINSTEVNDTTTDDKKASVECWKNIETAATELHGKAYSQIADAYDVGTVSYSLKSGSADKLTTARKIGNASFNGSADISLSSIGAAASSHTHSYAGSASAGGAANSAVKMASARKIGNANFDGTANITLAQMGAAAQSQVDELQKTVDYIVATQEIDGGDLMDNGPAENTFDGGTL